MIAAADTEGDPLHRFRAHAQLAALHGLLGRYHEALSETRPELAAARQTDLNTVLFMALDDRALTALRVASIPEALAAATEALAGMGNDALYDLARGKALTLLAACRVAVGDYAAASRALEDARSRLEPQAALALAAGAHAGLARWWAVSARLRAAQGHHQAAADAWQEAVARLRHVVGLPHIGGPYAPSALARTLRGLGHALTDLGSTHLAEQVFAESRQLRESVGLPPFAADEPTL